LHPKKVGVVVESPLEAVVEPLELLLGAVVTVQIAVTVVSARSVVSVVSAAAEDVRDVEVPVPVALLVAMESAPMTVALELDVLPMRTRREALVRATGVSPRMMLPDLLKARRRSLRPLRTMPVPSTILLLRRSLRRRRRSN